MAFKVGLSQHSGKYRVSNNNPSEVAELERRFPRLRRAMNNENLSKDEANSLKEEIEQALYHTRGETTQ